MSGSFQISMSELVDRHARPAWRTDLVVPEIGGGRIGAAELSALDRSADPVAVAISGLEQRGFEVLIERHGDRLRALHLWKCPRIDDLTPLEQVPSLTHLAVFWNQRATRLWDLTKTPNLVGLQLADFTRLRALDQLVHGRWIEELMVGDFVWPKMVVDSLEPLAPLGRLRSLEVMVKRIEDGRIEPLAQLRALEHLASPTNLWTTAQCAWLRAHLPEGASGRVLEPVLRLPASDDGDDRDVLVVGKRKPLLSATRDAERIARHVDDYWALVERFREDPTLRP